MAGVLSSPIGCPKDRARLPRAHRVHRGGFLQRRHLLRQAALAPPQSHRCAGTARPARRPAPRWRCFGLDQLAVPTQGDIHLRGAAPSPSVCGLGPYPRTGSSPSLCRKSRWRHHSLGQPRISRQAETLLPRAIGRGQSRASRTSGRAMRATCSAIGSTDKGSNSARCSAGSPKGCHAPPL